MENPRKKFMADNLYHCLPYHSSTFPIKFLLPQHQNEPIFLSKVENKEYHLMLEKDHIYQSVQWMAIPQHHQ